MKYYLYYFRAVNYRYVIFELLHFFPPQIYKRSMENLLPTPAKSHYTFNLRDFSRVIRGCLLIERDAVESRHTMIRLFVHEVLRVFYDRLINDDDRKWLFNLIKTVIKDHFKEPFDTVFSHLRKENAFVSIFSNQKHVKLKWDFVSNFNELILQKCTCFLLSTFFYFFLWVGVYFYVSP